jgi:hypothetical protein
MTRRPRPFVPGPARPIASPRVGRFDRLPDVRDGLTRVERVILYVLHETQRERGGRDVPTAMLYGRVVEHIDISVEELQRVLQRMAGVEGGSIERRPSPFSGQIEPDDRGDTGGEPD